MHALSEKTVAYRRPETELTGLTRLSRLQDHDARLRAIVAIAETLRTEDGERQRRRWAGGTPVRVDGDPTAFDALPNDQRRRLIVRVLCELVAYGEDLDSARPVRERLAADAP